MNDMSLKAKIRNISIKNKISAYAILQNYLMRRFLYRLSLTNYKEKFVVKGGMLISSLVGIESRSTMDIDTTLKNLPLTEEAIIKAFDDVFAVNSDDGIMFTLESISPIRDDDEYGGYRVAFKATLGKINAPMSMDISTGDIITPGARKHLFKDMFDDSASFELWGYNLETILAEKVETILSRGIDNTRIRDFYDVYMLSAYSIDKDIFKTAYKATATHRGSYEQIRNHTMILEVIAVNPEMNTRWSNYVRQMPFAGQITFDDAIQSIMKLMNN